MMMMIVIAALLILILILQSTFSFTSPWLQLSIIVRVSSYV
jgi:hypothetical protein